ncbi:SMI1/KNR4 family protein [Sporosarcina oncorhynchi]|uniref:SMI1/KNR4 family protein n=1 Tax=Sporosarcina oncorhynchi TaxID=3056444 RepID=A0ABZ0L9M6_9BACL|nr:SMI1/KNR4 family protein [Sporosarcina sp. T2O-4]WOV88362.1 SMI1/KNR4 family protein [Sporosarcina sp. T2O-4]
MWKDYISTISKDYSFKRPASVAEIGQITEELNVELPKKLLEIYKETNGVYDIFECHLLWPTERIVEDNLFFRNFTDYKDIYMPFDHLLFFSDNGCGDLFGYKILNGCIQTEDIYVWNHEDDSRTRVASSLESFIKGWITGGIST